MTDAEILIFKSWPHPVFDHFDQRPDGTYSQLAWLPTIGPTSWLLWSIVAGQLRAATDDITWDSDDLARALGIAPANRHGRAVARVIKRLCCYRLLDRHGYVLRVRTSAHRSVGARSSGYQPTSRCCTHGSSVIVTASTDS